MLKKYVLSFQLFTILLALMASHVVAHDLPPNKSLSDYIRPYDSEVIKLAEFIGLKPFLSYPIENARSAYYWVSENIQYRFDNQTWGVQDYWQLPGTTIRLLTGDCEDQAILLASLLRALRLPRENVRVAVSYKQRHAWVEIKIPLPIYGLESVAGNLLEQLKNKRITISIGEASLSREITGDIINEIKAAGLSHNNGWIPLDTTAKIMPGYPVPFSWWLTYGYNVYALFGCIMTPEQTFQDKARIWEESREIGAGESITFEVPCMSGDRILGVAKARNAEKTRILISAGPFDQLAGYYGPFYIKSGEKLRVEWTADRQISVYILNELDLQRWLDYYRLTCGGPTSWRTVKTDDKGTLEYLVPNPDDYYVVIYVLHTILGGYPARIYSWTVKHIWQETTCSVQVSVINPQGTIIFSDSISKREVEKRFEFTAERNGVYKVVLKNVGDSAPLHVRLEEYSTPLSPEIEGFSENLVFAEQEYIDKITNSLGENNGGNWSGFAWKSPLNIMIFSATSIIVIVTVVLILKKKSIFVFIKNR